MRSRTIQATSETIMHRRMPVAGSIATSNVKTAMPTPAPRFWPSWMTELPSVRRLALSMICGAADCVTVCWELKKPPRKVRM